MKFGRYTIISEPPLIGKHKRVIVRCECGAEKSSILWTVLLGKAKECRECKTKKHAGSTHPSWTGYGEITGAYFGHLKIRAKMREIPFELSIEDAWNLFVKQKRLCALTGLPLMFKKNWKGKQTASLDRIDSDGPYHISNVQWVHKDVNRMKMGMGQEHFLRTCRQIAYRRPGPIKRTLHEIDWEQAREPIS